MRASSPHPTRDPPRIAAAFQHHLVFTYSLAPALRDRTVKISRLAKRRREIRDEAGRAGRPGATVCGGAAHELCLWRARAGEAGPRTQSAKRENANTPAGQAGDEGEAVGEAGETAGEAEGEVEAMVTAWVAGEAGAPAPAD